MGEVKETLLALVKSKFAKGKGKGKDKGKGKAGKASGGSGGKATGMEVDDPVCFECGESMRVCGHSAKDCPVRKARVAAGGPERLPKGAGKGGKAGKGGWPNRTQWNSYYPGPSQAQWRGWFPQQPLQGGGPPAGKVNLFEQPSQLSAVTPLQALLNGNCFAIRPKDKAQKKEKTFEHKNKWQALATRDEPDGLRVNVMDALKKPSLNKQRKGGATLPMRRRREDYSDDDVDPLGSGGGGTPPLMRQPGRNPAPGKTAVDARHRKATNTRIATTTSAIPKTSATSTTSTISTTSTTPTAKTTPRTQPLLQAMLEFVNGSFVSPAEPSCRGGLKRFNPVQHALGLRPLHPTREAKAMGGKFEILSSIVDSGATIPVMHPDDAKAYELLESQASREGVEYEVANGDSVPNLGEKKFACLTSEGTLRGYSTQCADVQRGKPLQAVRALLASGHAVCFGLGIAGNDHLIINKMSGEINRMRDDGINYLQDVAVVPQDQIEEVQRMLDEAAMPETARPADMPELVSPQDFTWQGQ